MNRTDFLAVAIGLLTMACGGTLGLATSDAGDAAPADAAPADAQLDARELDAPADVQLAHDANVCPVLGAPCSPVGELYCDPNDPTLVWTCEAVNQARVWTTRPCAASDVPYLCNYDVTGLRVCVGKVCK